MSVGALNSLKGGQRTAPPGIMSCGCVCTVTLLCSSCEEALVDKATAASTLVQSQRVACRCVHGVVCP